MILTIDDFGFNNLEFFANLGKNLLLELLVIARTNRIQSVQVAGTGWRDTVRSVTITITVYYVWRTCYPFRLDSNLVHFSHIKQQL